MQYMNVELSKVGPDHGERRIVVTSPEGVEFGVFDGYKDGADGVARPATPDWLEGKTVEAALLATIDGEVELTAGGETTIAPNRSEPTDYHGHQFVGSFLPRGESRNPLSELRLYDGLRASDDGVPLAGKSASLAVLSVGEGNMLVNMNDLNHDLADIDRSGTYRISAARTDLLGYRGLD